MMRVSVVMPCYNRADTVRRAVESVFNQTCQDLELIAVDDASSDDTNKILSELAAADPRMRVVVNESNSGPGASRNAGIAAAQGQWIAFLDSDDWYEPRRLDVLLENAEEDGAQLVADNQYLIRQNAARPFYRLRQNTSDRPKHLTAYDLLKGDRWGRMTNLGLLKPVVQRQLLIDHGLRYDEEFNLGEDFYFLMKCMECASYLLFVAQPLYNYEIRKGSLGSSPSVDTMRATLEMHKRYAKGLGERAEPTMLALMDKRMADLENAIRYKQLIVLIKELDWARSLKQIVTDPGVLPILARMCVLHLGRRIAYLRRSITRASL